MTTVPAWASCTAGPTVVCSGTTDLGTTAIGTGPNNSDDYTVTVEENATVSAGNANAISLGNNAVVTVKAGASVTNKATTTKGLWNSGGDTVEFNSNGYILVETGASIQALGSNTSGEAINVMGSGNYIENYGLISGLNSAAIWFEDRTIGAANTVDNYGTIQTGSGQGSILKNVIGNQANSDVHFINRAGAIVYGSLSFASGNDTLELFPGSVITGGFNGGGGTNTLTLNGESGSSDALTGDIKNFQYLTKTGLGTWTLTGTIGNNGGGTPLSVEVQQGTLALTGDNTNFNGSILVDAGGTLEARAQSLPATVTDNGRVLFNQPDDGTYAGVISGSGSVTKIGAGRLELTGTNTYSGGTVINEGTVAAGADSAFGATSGRILIDGGTLEFTQAFDPPAARVISLGSAGGGIKVDSGTVTLSDNDQFTGGGSFTKSGSGELVIVTDNSNTGGNTVAEGKLTLGNGGTTGSLTGDVTIDAAGTLVINRSNEYVFTNNVSNSGDVEVKSGMFFFDGTMTGSGTVHVDSGAKLSGSGTIEGAVTVADNAIISAGPGVVTPGELTVGDLTLNNDSILFFNMVEPGDGGPLNDVIQVNGDLVLDGVLHIYDQGQTLVPGIYRLINYTGTLTDNTLEIGDLWDANHQPTRPLGSDFFVQTAVPGHVNLVNATGLSLNYWDGGDTGGANNGTIYGGDGEWHRADTDDLWTDSTGNTNAPWHDGEFAIFAGHAGTVIISDVNGDVTASGMQFMTDGYVLTGSDGLTLVSDTSGGSAVIRVGDGTSASKDMTATISADISGDVQLRKADQGTLVLLGTNSHTGGTAIDGGVLEIASDSALGAAGTDFNIAGGTLHTTATIDLTGTPRNTVLGNGGGTLDVDGGTTLTNAGVISGVGKLTKAGDGLLILANHDTYTGGTEITAGTLQLGNGTAVGNNSADGSIVGDITNNAALVFDQFDAYTFGGVISGSGTVTQQGAGAVTLTADNTYTGTTTIAGGATLQLGDGGTAGGIQSTANVVNDGTLIFDRSDEVTFDKVISGSGNLVKNGDGALTLTATETYTGTTQVNEGSLYVNGSTAASSQTTVADGARLSGNGTVGNTTIEAGGMLAPGAVRSAPGTLTVAGNLVMDQDSILYINLVDPGVAGGARNDLVQVNGDLTLNGAVLHVYDQGQSFLPGVYRVFNYTGTLTVNNDGMTIGTVWSAPGTDTASGLTLDGFEVQTSVKGQVNLVNTTGLALNYWDGGNTGVYNDNIIDGGDGIWVNAVNTAWTDARGDANATWDVDNFAIFSADAGTVTVDDSQGAVVASGMQFMTDGYVITGDALTLTPATGDSISTIRVGDGSTQGGDITATIDAVLTGSATLEKSDLGTLILTGINTYTGGTLVSEGRLQISDDHNLGAIGTGVTLNEGILHTTADITTDRAVTLAGDGGSFEVDGGTTLTVNNPVSGDGSLLRKEGDGTLALLGDNTYTGGTLIWGGTVELKGADAAILGDVDTGNATDGSGTLKFNKDGGSDYTFAGVISGEGGIEQAGSDKVILTGVNTYTGGTTIGDGSVLQLDANGTLGEGDTSVGADGELIFNNYNYEYSHVISGDGGVKKTGSFITVLSGENTYTGETVVDGYMLAIGNGGTEGSINNTSGVSVTSGSNFVFYRSDDIVFSAPISGEGNVVNAGSGMVTLTGDSTVSGLLGISTGAAIRVGDGGTSGSVSNVSRVNNNGELIFDRSDTITMAAPITGSGSLEQAGSGTLVLTGISTYRGGTTITDGTVQIGDGGITGSIVGNVAISASGTLDFNRDGLLVMTGVISGDGSVTQDGPGTTVLTGSNTYNGPTNVQSGSLYVNGDMSGSGSDFTIQGGALLGGTGTIGTGTVTVDGTLSPGDTGVAPGTLTMDGDLVLNSDAVLAYNFGQANVVGGAYNDLTVVKGDLTLDGSIKVSLTEGGKFDVGVYRVINYDGSLTDNGLDIAAPLPDGADLHVQTAIAHQVNLVNYAGLALNYWDNAGGEDNSNIEGGTGTWHKTGDKYWTNTMGTPNAQWEADAFAIFMGASGTVSIDNASGDVSASGMQFAVDGYTLDGDALTLVHGGTQTSSLIRVGDGTTDGKNMTATISAVVQGNAVLEKSDLGTLVLSGTNTYTGGTIISGGTLQIASDDNLGQSGTDLALSGGTLHTTADITTSRAALLGSMGGTFDTDAGTTLTLSTGVSDWTAGTPGRLDKTGAGTLVLAAPGSYSGGTHISGGTIEIADDAALGAADGVLGFCDDDGNILHGGGTLHVTATTSGARPIAVETMNQTSGATFTIDDGVTYSTSGTFTGYGQFVKDGGGTFVISGNGSLYSGIGLVSAGVLAVDGSLGGVLTVDSQGTLKGYGHVGDVYNAGVVAPGRSIGTLTIDGDYYGTGGILEIETVLGDDNSPTDRLIVRGNTSGATPLYVFNVGGTGALTKQGIKIIDVGGSSDGVFTLANGDHLIDGNPAIVVGAYSYQLYKGGVSTPNDGDWYLRSGSTGGGIYQPGAPVYEPIPVTLLALNELPTLQQRVGERDWGVLPERGWQAWGRMVGGRTNFTYDHSSTSVGGHVDTRALQAGVDFSLGEDSHGGNWVAGLNVRYGEAEARMDSTYGAGRVNSRGFGAGASLTRYADNGVYVDLQAQVSRYESDIFSNVLGMRKEQSHGLGYALSAEVGRRFAIAPDWYVTPQAQLRWSSVHFNDFTDPNGARVSLNRGHRLTGRVGAALEHRKTGVNGKGERWNRKLYGIANVLYEFNDTTSIDISSVTLQRREPRVWGEIGLGASVSWKNEKYTLYGEVSYKAPFSAPKKYHAVQGMIGFRMKF
jgi:fibronectin-binding autotransporter adhesin